MSNLQYYSISADALPLIYKESNRKIPDETGGILIGKYECDAVIIEVAIGPGPNAKHRRNSFQRDGDYAQEHLDDIVRKTEGRWDYLGEWHSHPRKMGPSWNDLSSLKKIRQNHGYFIDNPILGLTIFEDGNWKFYSYVLKENLLCKLILK